MNNAVSPSSPSELPSIKGPSAMTATPPKTGPVVAPPLKDLIRGKLTVEPTPAKEAAPSPPTPAPKPKEEPVILRVILSQEQVEAQLISLIQRFQETVHVNALAKGFWENPNEGEKIALMHSELSEALEGVRKGNPPDDKVPEFTETETELADAMIRILDFAHYYKLRLPEAMPAKHKFNVTRPYKHGKNF